MSHNRHLGKQKSKKVHIMQLLMTQSCIVLISKDVLKINSFAMEMRTLCTHTLYPPRFYTSLDIDIDNTKCCLREKIK